MSQLVNVPLCPYRVYLQEFTEALVRRWQSKLFRSGSEMLKDISMRSE